MDQDEVVMILRSCLISCKGGIKLENLSADYRMIAGESLPYKKFGFSSIESFIRHISDIKVTSKNGDLFVEALPSRTTVHLTKLVSRQVSKQKKRKPRVQAKKWGPPRFTSKGNSSGYWSNSQQSSKTNHEDSSSFTKSTPGRSNLYTDFSRPVPLMSTVVHYPGKMSNGTPRFAIDTPHVSPSKRLTDKLANLNVSAMNQSCNVSKTTPECKDEVLKDKTNEPTSVITSKPKSVEMKSSKLSDRLKVKIKTPPPINGHISSPLISKASQSASIITIDPKKDLSVRANILGLSEPVYKTYSKKEKDPAKTTIYASVKIGTYTFHTFPEDARSVDEAQKLAARLALVHLAKDTSSPKLTTIDVKLVKERIYSIVTKHHSGVFMHQLPSYYSEQYGEALPDNWQRIIEESSEINKEEGVGNSTILCRSMSSSQRRDVNAPSRDVTEVNTSSSEKIQLSPIGPAAPEKLKVPNATLWNVYTTCIISTVEVWVRLVDNDYNDNFIDMMSEMTEYYNQTKESVPVSECVVGDFYAIFEDDYWHRAQCIDFDADAGLATVVFIDAGYEEQHKSSALYSLEKKFSVLPAQAVRVALQGLEEFQDCDQAITEIENYLEDQVFCVKVHGTNVDENGTYVTVTFYDTSGEDDVDINKHLFTKILDNITTVSKLRNGQLVELHITHFDKCGKVYAQRNSFAKTCLLNLLNNETMSKVPLSIMMNALVRKVDPTKLYLVQLNSQWYRVRVMDVHDDYEVTAFLVDVGKTVTALKGNLLCMNIISKALQSIPPQAVQIFLLNIDQSMYGEKLVTRFNELVSSTDLLLAKVIRVETSGIPVMEIFKRVESSNLLASINTSLIIDEELTKSNEDGNNNIKPKKRLERKNSRIPEPGGKLNPPKISDIGQYFDVHVTLAAHPGHFIVQPLNDSDNLRAMMVELQKSCESYAGPSLESIGEGKLYAGKFKDNFWYRVYVTNIISENMISVYFCDFGDVTIVPRSNLQPLRSEFLNLPYQAVKAKLVGIQPTNTDWSVEDCVRFQDLVLGKNFVSIVVESMDDNYSPANGTVLGLHLIDVSTEKDIFIDKLLVQENRAKFLSENLPSS